MEKVQLVMKMVKTKMKEGKLTAKMCKLQSKSGRKDTKIKKTQWVSLEKFGSFFGQFSGAYKIEKSKKNGS